MNPVTEFELAFAKKIGIEYAIAVNSGTSALHAALVAIDVKGYEVIMPALCPAMVAFAIIHAGGTPVYADVDPKTHLITAETIKPCIGKKTKAVICVHLHGLACDMDPILNLSRTYKLWLVEDCAQALLATYNGKATGTAGHISCFSFERKKHMTTGSEGGCIVTNDETLASMARNFAGLGYRHLTAREGRTSLDASVYQRPDYERFDTIGLNYRLSEAQAEIGLRKLKYDLDAAVERRQKIGLMWQHALGTALQPHTYDAGNVFYTAAYEFKGNDHDWIMFYKNFCNRGGDAFYAMPLCPYMEPALDLKGKRFCSTAERLQRRLMLFKTHYKTIQEAQRQCDIVEDMLCKV